jgi:hypothetical protein
MPFLQTLNRRQIPLGLLAAGLGLILLAAGPAGRAAADQFLAQFRAQRFAVIAIDPASRSQPFKELEQLGRLNSGSSRVNSQTVASAELASRQVGFAVQEPAANALPAGTGRPRIEVLPANEARLTFDRARAREYFAAQGRADLQLPDRFDGATLVIRRPAGVVLSYPSAAGDRPLLVGQFEQVTAGVEGKPSLDELRDYLLGLPSLSPETARQLRAIQDWRSTLPLPLPADQVQWRETTVNGGPGLALAETGGAHQALIWQRDGRVYGVAGQLKADEILRIASSLR